MARPKKQITPVEVTPDFSISLSKKGMSISVSKVDGKLTVSTTPLDRIKDIYDLMDYRDLLNSVIGEYVDHTIEQDDCVSDECDNSHDNLTPCYCHQ